MNDIPDWFKEGLVENQIKMERFLEQENEERLKEKQRKIEELEAMLNGQEVETRKFFVCGDCVVYGEG